MRGIAAAAVVQVTALFSANVAMIQFGGHLPKGEYDVDHDGHAGQADAASGSR